MNIHPCITRNQHSVVGFSILKLNQHRMILSCFKKRKWQLKIENAAVETFYLHICIQALAPVYRHLGTCIHVGDTWPWYLSITWYLLSTIRYISKTHCFYWVKLMTTIETCRCGSYRKLKTGANINKKNKTYHHNYVCSPLLFRRIILPY